MDTAAKLAWFPICFSLALASLLLAENSGSSALAKSSRLKLYHYPREGRLLLRLIPLIPQFRQKI
jgi:hypothetical protein